MPRVDVCAPHSTLPAKNNRYTDARMIRIFGHSSTHACLLFKLLDVVVAPHTAREMYKPTIFFCHTIRTTYSEQIPKPKRKKTARKISPPGKSNFLWKLRKQSAGDLLRLSTTAPVHAQIRRRVQQQQLVYISYFASETSYMPAAAVPTNV